MKCSMIVACANNGVIGIDNRLPWHLPNDLKYFKKVTMSKPIIMGRATFDSIGRPLPGRLNIVITRNELWSADGVEVVHSLEAAIDRASSHCRENGIDEVMIIGGAKIYEASTAVVDRLYLTRVDAEVEGDAYFDRSKLDDWKCVSSECFDPCEQNPFRYCFEIYEP